MNWRASANIRPVPAHSILNLFWYLSFLTNLYREQSIIAIDSCTTSLFLPFYAFSTLRTSSVSSSWTEHIPHLVNEGACDWAILTARWSFSFIPGPPYCIKCIVQLCTTCDWAILTAPPVSLLNPKLVPTHFLDMHPAHCPSSQCTLRIYLFTTNWGKSNNGGKDQMYHRIFQKHTVQV